MVFQFPSKRDMLKPVMWVSSQALACLPYVVLVLLSFWRPVQVAIFRFMEGSGEVLGLLSPRASPTQVLAEGFIYLLRG